MVICLEQGADLHMAQLMLLPLTVSCFSKIQIGFTFLVPAHPGSPYKRAVKRVCVCVIFTVERYVSAVFGIILPESVVGSWHRGFLPISTYPTLCCKDIKVSKKSKVTFLCNFVPNSRLIKISPR